MEGSRRRWWLGGLILLGMGLIVGSVLWVQGLPPIWPRTNNGTVAPAELSRIDCIGLVDLEEGVLELSPTRSGRIVDVKVQENQPVAAGKILLKVDEQPAQYQEEQSVAAVSAAQARLQQILETAKLHTTRITQQQALLKAARRRLAAARHMVEHKKKLRAINLLKQEDLDAARERVKEQEALLSAEWHTLTLLQNQDPNHPVKQAQADLSATQARLKQARYHRKQCTLIAPEAGMVLRINVAVGEIFNPAGPQPAILFIPKRPKLVRAEVEQEFVGLIAKGQSALVKDESDFSKTWKGQVKRLGQWYSQRRTILQQPPRYTDVATLECLIAIDPGQAPLRLGQRMIVTINTKSD